MKSCRSSRNFSLQEHQSTSTVLGFVLEIFCFIKLHKCSIILRSEDTAAQFSTSISNIIVFVNVAVWAGASSCWNILPRKMLGRKTPCKKKVTEGTNVFDTFASPFLPLDVSTEKLMFSKKLSVLGRYPMPIFSKEVDAVGSKTVS